MKSGFARRIALYGPLACALTSWSPHSLALDPALDVIQYAHTAWRVRDGFAKGAILAIDQTPDGYLWLGTEFGLLRFDGVRAVPWQPPPGQKLPSDFILSLLVSSDGTLWIGTLKGLASWHEGRLTLYPELSGFGVSALAEDREGTVWVGEVSYQPLGRLCSIGVKGGPVACWRDATFGKGVSSLYEDREGALWVGAQAALWRWKPGQPHQYAVPASELNGVRAVSEKEKAALLVGLHTGLKSVVGAKLASYRVAGRMQPNRVNRLLLDRGASLWIGTFGSGIWHEHRGRADRFAGSDGLSGDTVQCIFEDREGTIWVGTDQGLDRFRAFAAVTFSSRQGLPEESAASVLAGRDGSLWVGTFGGLSRWNGKEFAAVPLVGGLNDGTNARVIPNSLYRDSDGRLWVSKADGLGFLNDGRFISIPGMPGGLVYAMAEDGPGSLWVANVDLGLFHLSRMRVEQQIPWSALGHRQHAAAMVADGSGGLWLGFADGGVARLAAGKVVASHSAADGLAAGAVTDLHVDERGNLWAAAEGGLSRIVRNRIDTLTRNDGLPCDGVHHLVEDDDHAFWLFTPCGLVRVNRSELERWLSARATTTRIAGKSPAPPQILALDASDGVMLRPSAAGGYSPKVAKSSDGRLWFATDHGVSVIDPRHLPFNKLPPPVHIEQITANHQVYDATLNMRLPPLIRDLQIDYTALSLAATEKVQFRYKLEGRDRDWQNPSNRRQAFYTDLPPGQYRFRVIASNNSGVWNEQGDVLDFSIAPAYWQTNWFRALCVAVLLALLGALYQLRVRQLKREFGLTLERKRAEEALRALESDLAHMHRVSMMGELAASLAHEITQPIASARNNARAAQNFLELLPPELSEVKEALACVVGDVDRAGDIIDRMREQIKKAPPRKERFELNAAINEVIVLARNAIIRHGVSVQTRLADGLLPVHGDRVQLQQVVLNLILNAVEAMVSVEAGERELLISTEEDHTGVLVAVRDSGSGIDAEDLEQVFEAFYTTKPSGVGLGLSICRSIIDAHGGRLWAKPNEPRGAVFQFTLPRAEVRS